jgi:anti-sigma regulatory factor (Ser/Thr protein kinase)
MTLRLAATVESVRAARHAVDAIDQLNDFDEAAFNTRLLVTELVGNSVRHAGLDPADIITLDLEVRPGTVRVEVRDPGPGFSRPSFDDQPPLGTSGRGLYLVDALADRWGVSRTPGGEARVWFEIDILAAPASAARAAGVRG